MISKRSGFTVVELLVVIVVIGILSGLAAVGYKGMQNKAIVTDVKADGSRIADMLELYYLKNKQFPADLTSLGQINKSKNTSVAYDSNTTSFCLTTFNVAAGNKSFTVRDDASIKEGDCSGWVAHDGQSPDGGTSTPTSPTAPPTPLPHSMSYDTYRTKLSNGSYVQRYDISTSGVVCTSGNPEWKMGVTGGSSAPWSSWSWQQSNSKTMDLPENGIYSPVDTTIYSKARCVIGSESTEGATVQQYNGAGGGTGGSI